METPSSRLSPGSSWNKRRTTRVDRGELTIPERLLNIIRGVAVGRSDSLQVDLRELLTAVRSYFDMDVAFISHFEGNMRYIELLELGPGAETLALQEGDAGPREWSFCQRVADGRMPRLIVDAQTHPSSSGLSATRDIGIGTHMSVPIWDEGDTYGMLCCFSTKVNQTISDRDIKVMELLGTLVGQRIARAREEDQQYARLQKEVETLIQSRAFRTVFQPIKHINTWLTSGYEALTRFENGLPPDDVFKAAGQVQLQASLETAAVRSAVSTVSQLQEGCYLSVNVSAGTVADPEFRTIILSGRPERIVLELTEHDAVENYQQLIADLAPLRAANVRLAVDDVGSGYASFQHILSLVPDMIKLDRSLVTGLSESQAKRAMVAAMAGFARETGTTLVAEGIETENERQAALQLGVEFGQGYLFGRPTDALAWTT